MADSSYEVKHSSGFFDCLSGLSAADVNNFSTCIIQPSQDDISYTIPSDVQMPTSASRPNTPSSINSSDSEQSSGVNGANSSGTSDLLVRWEEAHVKLLIVCWKKFKHLFKGKKTKKEIFTLIAFEFNKNCKENVTGDQCLRKWGKLVSQHKEVEDHNKKTGNSRKDWKFYDAMAECLEGDVSVNPSFTLESSAHFTPNITQQCDDNGDCTDDEKEDEAHDVKQKRCRKRPRSRSSAAEMLDFLKAYSEKREKVEEEKLKIVKEMKEEKKEFFDKFLKYLEKKP